MLKEKREGDIVAEASIGYFDVLAHSVPCSRDPNPGWLYKRIAAAFNTNIFILEGPMNDANYQKLARIEWKSMQCPIMVQSSIEVVNMYTHYSNRADSAYGIPLDYDALRICLRKLNDEFEGKKVAIPGMIGCDIAGGDEEIVRRIIDEECYKLELYIIYPTDAVRRNNVERQINASVL